MKTILTIICIALLPSFSHAQKNELKHGAFGGANGIYIDLGPSIVTEGTPVNGVTSYLVERKDAAGNPFKAVATITAPASQKEFEERLSKALPVTSFNMKMTDLSVDDIWKRAAQYHHIDSLGYAKYFNAVKIALGLMYVDSSASKSVVYYYRISYLDSKKQPLQKFEFEPVSYPGKSLVKALLYSSYDFNNGKITMHVKTAEGKRPAFIAVYRQTKLNEPFTLVHTLQRVKRQKEKIDILITDTLVQKFHLYKYKLIPMDLFLNEGPSTTTEVLGAYNYTDVSLPENLHTESSENPAGLKIAWSVKQTGMSAAISIYRSLEHDGTYTKMADVPVELGYWIDQTAVPMQQYFYYTQLNSPAGEQSPRSSRFFGSYAATDKPLAPVIKKIENTKTGIHLSIEATDNNLTGFRVYRNAGFKEKMEPVSDLILIKKTAAEFTDSSTSLSGEMTYGYAVVAESFSHVLSSPSDTLYIQPAKETHPNPVIDLTARRNVRGVTLFWNNPSAEKQHIFTYSIFVYAAAGKEKSTAEYSVKGNINSFTDTLAGTTKSILYGVQAIDIFGGKSDIIKVQIDRIPEENVAAPTKLSARKTPEGIILSWNEMLNPDLKEFHIYRYTRGKKAELISSPASGDTSFTDKKTVRGESYFYFITAEEKSGKESAHSNEVSIAN